MFQHSFTRYIITLAALCSRSCSEGPRVNCSHCRHPLWIWTFTCVTGVVPLGTIQGRSCRIHSTPIYQWFSFGRWRNVQIAQPERFSWVRTKGKNNKPRASGRKSMAKPPKQRRSQHWAKCKLNYNAGVWGCVCTRCVWVSGSASTCLHLEGEEKGNAPPSPSRVPRPSPFLSFALSLFSRWPGGEWVARFTVNDSQVRRHWPHVVSHRRFTA